MHTITVVLSLVSALIAVICAVFKNYAAAAYWMAFAVWVAQPL